MADARSLCAHARKLGKGGGNDCRVLCEHPSVIKQYPETENRMFSVGFCSESIHAPGKDCDYFEMPEPCSKCKKKRQQQAEVKVGSSDYRGTVLFLTWRRHRVGPTENAIRGLRADGWNVIERPTHQRAKLWKIPEYIDDMGGKPDIVLRWEECGVLFSNHQWRDTCDWCYERGIIPIQIDFGYFCHYKTFILDPFTRDGKPSAKDIWETLPTEVDWKAADPKVLAYVEQIKADYARAESLGPAPGTEPGYVLVYLQYSKYLSSFKVKDYDEWTTKADQVIRDAGLIPVWKHSPVHYTKVPPGSLEFGRKVGHDRIELLNHRLLRFAKHAVIITSSVSNEAVINERPLVSSGKAWHSGLGVFAEAQKWEDLAVTPEIDAENRARWINFWLKRQAAMPRIAEKVNEIVAEKSTEGTFSPKPNAPAKVVSVNKGKNLLYIVERHVKKESARFSRTFGESGWAVVQKRCFSGKPYWRVNEFATEMHGAPAVVLRWEGGGLRWNNDNWKAACGWCHERGILPIQMDFGYFAHRPTLFLDPWDAHGETSIKRVWESLPEKPDWSAAGSRVTDYIEEKKRAWADVEELGPVPGTQPGYVLVFLQSSAFLSSLPHEGYPDWILKAGHAIEESGLVPVFKQTRVHSHDIPEGWINFKDNEGIQSLNARLLCYARHSVVMTSSVSNEPVLYGLPVVGCGRSWYNDLGVFTEAKDWADLAKTPEVDDAARGKWMSFWIQRQIEPGQIAKRTEELLAEFKGSTGEAPKDKPAKSARRRRRRRKKEPPAMSGEPPDVREPTASEDVEAAPKPEPDPEPDPAGELPVAGEPSEIVYLSSIGLGNLIMSIPTMKAMQIATGEKLNFGSMRALGAGQQQLMKAQPYVKTSSRRGPAIPRENVKIVATVGLGDPHDVMSQYPDTAKKIRPHQKFWPHESRRDMEVARELGFTRPMPSTKIRIEPPKTELPAQYVVVSKDCAGYLNTKRWPHWEEFARLWSNVSGISLVFVGLKPVDWAKNYGVDLIGKTDVQELAGIIQQADAIVTIDNGPSHIAGAVGTPAVVLYGPTSSLQFGPLCSSLTALSVPDLVCRPCHGLSKRKTCKSVECMARITPQRVVDATLRVLEKHGRPLLDETFAEQLNARQNEANCLGVHAGQSAIEIRGLWEIIKDMQIETVVEIGVRKGGWIFLMEPMFARNSLIIGMDIRRYPIRGKTVQVLAREGHTVKWLDGNSQKEETRDRLVEMLDGRQVDLLHIDGNHRTPVAVRDFDLYSPLVRSGGAVVMHDAVRQKDGVEKAIKQIVRDPKNVPRIVSHHMIAATYDRTKGNEYGIAVFRMK